MSIETKVNEENYEMQKYLAKGYPKLTKETLDIMANIILNINEEDSKYLMHALNKELNF